MLEPCQLMQHTTAHAMQLCVLPLCAYFADLQSSRNWPCTCATCATAAPSARNSDMENLQRPDWCGKSAAAALLLWHEGSLFNMAGRPFCCTVLPQSSSGVHGKLPAAGLRRYPCMLPHAAAACLTLWLPKALILLPGAVRQQSGHSVVQCQMAYARDDNHDGQQDGQQGHLSMPRHAGPQHSDCAPYLGCL